MHNLRSPVSKWCHLGCFLSFLILVFLPVRGVPGDRDGCRGDFCLLLGCANTHCSCNVGPGCGHRVNLTNLERASDHFCKAPVLLRPWCRRVIQDRGLRGMCRQVAAPLCYPVGYLLCISRPWGLRLQALVAQAVSKRTGAQMTSFCKPDTEAANSSFCFLLPLPKNHYTTARADSATLR